MDEQTSKLEQIKADYIDKQKRLALLDAGISYDDAGTYVKYIKTTDVDDMAKEAKEIVADVQGRHFADAYQDPRVWKPF